MATHSKFTATYVFVADMAASLAFYGRLGLEFDAAGGHFARAITPEGAPGLEFGTYALTQGYNPNWRQPGGAAKVTLNVELESREAVDDLYNAMTQDAEHGLLPPMDAFWGSRFAILLDPDGNEVGLHSPRDPERASAPPVR